MIKLNSTTFARAIAKAQQVAPACEFVDTDETNFAVRVSRAGGGFAIVDIWHVGGVLWTSCDCPAGTGAEWRRSPLACYHVAAAALSLGFLPAAPPLGAVINPAPEYAAGRQIPAPLLNPAELAPAAAIASPGRLRSALQSLAEFFWRSPNSARA